MSKIIDHCKLIFEPHGAFRSKIADEDWPFGYLSEGPGRPVFALHEVAGDKTPKQLSEAADEIVNAVNASRTPAPSDQAGWQDIATAPRDGTHFLATLTVRHIIGHRWRETHLIWVDDETGCVDSECEQGWDISDYEAWCPVPDFGPPTTPTLTAGEGGGDE